MKTILWAKILKENRLIKDVVITVCDFKNELLHDYIKEICYKLDLETPILLSKHYKSIVCYNTVKFTRDDFVDYIDFDGLLIEKCDE